MDTLGEQKREILLEGGSPFWHKGSPQAGDSIYYIHMQWIHMYMCAWKIHTGFCWNLYHVNFCCRFSLLIFTSVSVAGVKSTVTHADFCGPAWTCPNRTYGQGLSSGDNLHIAHDKDGGAPLEYIRCVFCVSLSAAALLNPKAGVKTLSAGKLVYLHTHIGSSSVTWIMEGHMPDASIPTRGIQKLPDELNGV